MRLGGVKGWPVAVWREGRGRAPRGERRVGFSEPPAAPMETYSLGWIWRFTPLRMSVAVSAVPRMRWTFWASRRALGAWGRASQATRLKGVGIGVGSSVRATDHL